MATKYVYFFGGGKAEGKGNMKHLLGGKGANLAEMTSIGLPVPPGFTISTEACDAYQKSEGQWPEGLAAEVDQHLARLEELLGKKLGDPANPLLVSVRSGAAASMPGMMDTVLNLGLNETSLKGLIARTGNERFGWDSYRRFVQMFGDVVLGLKPQSKEEEDPFEVVMHKLKKERGAKLDTDLSAADLKELAGRFKKAVKDALGLDFPEDPREQLRMAINAVFGSWNNPRAITYRRLNDIKGLLGTAVNVQAMVFGNTGEGSGTGVAFTRNPSTGENKFYGEFLVNAQGEDVVAGIRTPQPISELERVFPDCYKQLVGIRQTLEKHYKDMQDIEFTIEDGKLFMLQTRTGKRTAAAAVRCAVEMVAEKLIDKKTAVMRVEPDSLNQLLHPTFDPKAVARADVLASGLPASPGAASGRVVFHADEATQWAERGEKVILTRIETSPEDIEGMNVARGILTQRGGMTSHAAVVARGMGKCCISGCGDIKIDYKAKQFSVGETVVKEGDWISLDGSAGNVYLGQLATQEPELAGNFGTLMEWADSFRKIGVRTNSDTPHDTEVAVKFGAEGIGLTRTEHMFFEGERIVSFRRLILVADQVRTLRNDLAKATGADARAIKAKLEAPLAQYNRALAELLPHQRADFEGIFKALAGRPCTIRLLDPPLHEFLPADEPGQKEMAETMGVSVERIQRIVSDLHEFNPMLGLRGCRLGLLYPEVSDMQVRAIIEAAINVKRIAKVNVHPEIMIPLVGAANELKIARQRAERVISEVFRKNNANKAEIPYLIGTMIEVPRAAVTADEVAEHAEFFSFGTNDLTQMGCGFSRDDAGRFLAEYVKLGIYEKDPFTVLDQAGVGRLLKMGVELGRKTRPDLKCGICGEHGGEPASVKFCARAGLNYVSCSPFRVPIARLAAAQAAIEDAK
jgi:pyruvate,orthophosphate dikinase